MQLKLMKNVWESNENALGFYCVNIFQCSKQNPDLKELLESDILNDTEFRKVEEIENQLVRTSSDIYGSLILEKIEESDFEKFNFEQLKSNLLEYWKDENWGSDLLVFKENFKLALSNLNEFNLEERKYYLINAEKIDSSKITNPNFYTYLVCILSTKINSNEIITMTFGLD